MSRSSRPRLEEVEHLLRNAELRDELERYHDEALLQLNAAEVPTEVENEFLASMLAWERAPVLPIARWFEPELRLPNPATLSDDELHQVLWDTIHKLYQQRIVLDFTDHLSDRQLYRLIVRDILPSEEKKVDLPGNYLHWDCAEADGDSETWLRYYASEEERRQWAAETSRPLPPQEAPPYPRRLPGRPL